MVLYELWVPQVRRVLVFAPIVGYRGLWKDIDLCGHRPGARLCSGSFALAEHACRRHEDVDQHDRPALVKACACGGGVDQPDGFSR
jgi:hypothetical protein